MSNFEFNAKADEWLDVTSSEELLRNELSQAKNELETKQMELLESNVTIDLLKGHKTLLENQKDSLQRELDASKEVLDLTTMKLEGMVAAKESVDQNLENTQISSKLKIENLEKDLTENEKAMNICQAQICRLEKQMEGMKKSHRTEILTLNSKIEELSQLVEHLNGTIDSMRGALKSQTDKTSQTEKALEQSRDREEALRRELAKQTKLSEQRTKELKETKSGMRSVSIFAETLKEKNTILNRACVSSQKKLHELEEKYAACIERETHLQQECMKVKDYSNKQEQEINKHTTKLLELEETVRHLESDRNNLKESVSSNIEQADLMHGRWLDEKALAEKLSAEKKMLEQELEQKEASFAEEIKTASASSSREKELEKQLEAQKASYEIRLREIRSILGVSPITEIQSEFQTMAKMVNTNIYLGARNCPPIKSRALRSPLLTKAV